MNKSVVCKLSALILVTVIIVSFNLAAATTLTQLNDHGGNTYQSLGPQSAVTNHAREALSQPDYNWTATALSSYADDTGKLKVIVGIDNSTNARAMDHT